MHTPCPLPPPPPALPLQGPAYSSELLPEARRNKINPARNSQMYSKELEAPDSDMPLPGKRVGF